MMELLGEVRAWGHQCSGRLWGEEGGPLWVLAVRWGQEEAGQAPMPAGGRGSPAPGRK